MKKLNKLTLSILAASSCHAATVVVYTEDFTSGANEFSSGTANTVANGQLEIDLETRGNGTNFNGFAGPIISLSSVNISTITAVNLSVDLNAIGTNTPADTAATFAGGDQFGLIVTAIDASGGELGRYPAGGEFIGRQRLDTAGTYNQTITATQTGDLTTLFPTATQLRFDMIVREAGDGAGGGTALGLAGADFAVDNIIVSVEADLIPEPSSLLLSGLGVLALLRRRR